MDERFLYDRIQHVCVQGTLLSSLLELLKNLSWGPYYLSIYINDLPNLVCMLTDDTELHIIVTVSDV